MYIYVIQLDLLYYTGIQKNGFHTTSKQISLRFLRLSVEVPRSIIYKKNYQWKFGLKHCKIFCNCKKPSNLQFNVWKFVSQTLQDFQNCDTSIQQWNYTFLQMFKVINFVLNFCKFLQISSEKSKWTRNYSRFVELKEVSPNYHSNFKKKVINCQKPSSPLKQYFALKLKTKTTKKLHAVKRRQSKPIVQLKHNILVHLTGIKKLKYNQPSDATN